MPDLERLDAGLVAVPRLERGDRAAGIARGAPEFVERVVVEFGDVAALRALGGRRGHQRDRVEIDQRAVPGQARQQAGKQCGQAIAALFEKGVEASRFRQSVAQLAEVARGSAPRHHPAERPAQIGQRAQHRAQIFAQQGVLGQPLHQFEPLVDRGHIGERCGQVLGELPRTRTGDAAIDRVDQAALAASLARGKHFEAGSGRLVHGQMRLAAACDRRQQQRQRPPAGVIEIADQPSGGGQHGPREHAEAVERGDAVDRLEPRLAMIAGEFAQGPDGGVGRGFAPFVRDDHFRSAKPCQGGPKQVGRTFLQLHPPGRNIAGGNADGAAKLAHRRQHVGPARFKQSLFGQGPRGDEADDIARDQRLRSAALFGFLRAFHLLGDGHPAPCLDQPREITLRRVHRNPAHRDRLPLMLAARSEGDIENLGGGPGIVEKQLEEIAHPVEQQAIPCLGLEGEVLDHHRGGAV